jgi:hypothetical protein
MIALVLIQVLCTNLVGNTNIDYQNVVEPYLL